MLSQNPDKKHATREKLGLKERIWTQILEVSSAEENQHLNAMETG